MLSESIPQDAVGAREEVPVADGFERRWIRGVFFLVFFFWGGFIGLRVGHASCWVVRVNACEV